MKKLLAALMIGTFAVVSFGCGSDDEPTLEDEIEDALEELEEELEDIMDELEEELEDIMDELEDALEELEDLES